MKKILASAASLALALSFSTAVPTAAMADEGANDTAHFCQEIAEFFGASVGECVSYFRANNDPVEECKFLKEIGVLDFLGLNLGNCVSFVRHLD